MNRRQILLLIGFCVACGAFLLLPTKPSGIERESLIEKKVNQAVALVQNGTNPMQGIQLLLEVLKEDSLNQKALYHLGVFSIQSGQFEKAVNRFETLCKQEKLEFEDSWYLLSVAYASMGNSARALEILKNQTPLVHNDELKKAMEELELSINKK